MVLEYVRFTKLSLQEFYHFVNLDAMSPFWQKTELVDSLERTRKLHEAPVATRRSGEDFLIHTPTNLCMM